MFRNRILLSMLSLLAFCSMNRPLAANSADDLVKKVREKYSQLKTISLDFEQKSEWKLAGTSTIMTGKIFIKDDLKFRVEMSDLISVTDGKTIWNYSKSTNQVIVNNLKKADTEQLPSKILLQYSEKYNSKLLKEETFNKVTCHVLELSSKTGDDFIQKMKVWIDKKSLLTQKIEQYDINENVKTFIIISIQVDQPLEESLFSFETPKGVEEVDMRKK